MQTLYKHSVVTNIFKTPFLRNIFLAGLAIAIVLPLYTIFFVYPAYTQRLIEDAENDAKRTATHLARMITMTNHELTKNDLSNDIVIKEIGSFKDDLNLEKLQIFSKSGEILYSSNPKDIGEFNKEEYLHDVVDKGRVSTILVRKNSKSREGRPVTADVVETYVPIMKDDKLWGAFEIYYDITLRKQKLDALLIRSSYILFALASCLLIALIVILFKASQATIKEKLIEDDRERLILDLQDALAKVKTLSGLLPVCSACKKIRDDTGYWNQMEAFIRDHSDADFTHSICPECAKKLYGKILNTE